MVSAKESTFNLLIVRGAIHPIPSLAILAKGAAEATEIGATAAVLPERKN